ncbi:MAG TPA: carboxypeptidase regulatory-like domain-containing protein [Terriglobia bacterium]|nr:carboxypeptidase regulatory-like domain-containing protein [Terriglobia bacterium]
MKKLLILIPAVCMLTALGAYGAITGSISGRVTDPSGAVIPGTQVTAVDTGTAVQHATRTDASGFYSFPDLPIGVYEVLVRHQGFKLFRVTGLVINANAALRVDATLQIGATTESVTVTSAALHVETTSTQMGDVITGTQMTAIPLNGRSYTDLLALQPGVVPVQTGEYTVAASGANLTPSGNLNSGNLSISGGRESANGFMVNGGNVEEPGSNGAEAIPDLDAIAEFRILTNNFDAEYGEYSGGLINVVTKSGTNQFHGDGFDFLRNTSLDARNFYSYDQTNPVTGAQIPGSAIEAFRQNQFGGTFGGPIIHNKVFFFGDYQGTRTTQGEDTGLIAVPTIAERAGDFSAVSNQLAGNVSGPFFAKMLSSELGYPVSAGEPYYTSGCAASSQCVFPNAVIPQSAFSAPSAALLKYIPTPNLPGGFYSSSALNETLRDDKWSSRVDANTRAGMLSGYYFFDDWDLVNPYAGGTLPGSSAAANVARAQQAEFSDTKSFGATMVNVARLNFTRLAGKSDSPTSGVGPTYSSLGFAPPSAGGPNPIQPSTEGVPNVSTNEFTFGVDPSPIVQRNNTYQWMDDLTKVYGTHTLKFGGQLSFIQANLITSYGYNGLFSFTGAETGDDIADYLLGAQNSYAQGEQMPEYTRSRYGSIYGEDSWRAKPDLTLNYGVRWSVSTPWEEKRNELETLIYGKQSATFPGAPRGWVFPGDPGVPDTIAPIPYDNFAPRLGVAWSPGASGGLARRLFGGPGGSSFRAGYGIFYTSYEDAGSFNGNGDSPYGFYYVSPVPSLFAAPFIDVATGNNEGQRFPAALPPLNVSPSNPDTSVNWPQLEPISSSPVWEHTNRTPYTESYMFSFERQVASDNVLSVSYVGTQGHHLLVDQESNPSNPALCLEVSQLSEVVPGTSTCGPFGETGVFYPITGGVIVPRGPFGADFGSNAFFATAANSNYNALEVSLRHTSHRMTFLASYTYSKSLDNGSSYGSGINGGGEILNPVNPKLSEALSAFDLTHNFVFSYSYELPFDKLFRAKRLTQGWTLTGITRFATGLPVTITEPDDNSLYGVCSNGPGGCVDTPDFTPGPILSNTNPRSGKEYFNTSLFSEEPLGSLGNSNKRFFHGPGINDFDMALLKDVRLSERFRLEFRGEFFNIFNHAQFMNPNGNFNSSTFGYVTGANAPRIAQLAVKLLF